MSVQFTRKVTAEINLSAREWQLYSMDGDDKAAATLNARLAAAIGNAQSAAQAFRAFAPTMASLSNFGAADSEPIWVARKLCSMAFNEEEQWT